MSSIEYTDMFLKVQELGDAPYHMFSFDIKDSQKMSSTKRMVAQYDLYLLLDLFKKELQKLEKDLNRKILLEESELNNTTELLKDNPFVFGDALVVTIYKDSLTINDMCMLFNRLKDELKIKYDFNIAEALYETNNYDEGNEKLYRGYCAQILMELHKDQYKGVARELRSIKR